jgi:hypothetical protein
MQSLEDHLHSWTDKLKEQAGILRLEYAPIAVPVNVRRNENPVVRNFLNRMKIYLHTFYKRIANPWFRPNLQIALAQALRYIKENNIEQAVVPFNAIASGIFYLFMHNHPSLAYTVLDDIRDVVYAMLNDDNVTGGILYTAVDFDDTVLSLTLTEFLDNKHSNIQQLRNLFNLLKRLLQTKIRIISGYLSFDVL